MKDYRMFVNGALADAAEGATRTIINPATEESIATVPEGSQKDVDAAGLGQMPDEQPEIRSIAATGGRGEVPQVRAACL